MEKLKISEEQKKELDRLYMYIQAVSGDDKMNWHQSFYGDDFYDDLSGPYSDDSGTDIDDNYEGVILIQEIIKEYLSKYRDEITNSVFCDDCTESGFLTVSYYTKTKTIEIGVDVGYRIPNEYESSYTFQELINMQPRYRWDNYDNLKKLQDEDFINECIEEEGMVIEATYEGSGDDGYINETVSRNLEYLLYEILSLDYSGWENNEGGNGRIVIDFENKTASVEHTQYSEDSEYQDIAEIQLV